METIVSTPKIKFSDGQTFDTQSFLNSGNVAMKVVRLRKSQEAYVQGEPATSVIYIQVGKIKLSVVNESGKEAVVAILGPSDFLGEGCLAGQSVRMDTATALIPTTVSVIQKNEMMRAIRFEHALQDRFVSYLISRRIRSEEDLIDQHFNSSEKRLARALLMLTENGKQESPLETLPKISQETLAEMVGTTRSRVNFFMKKFRKQGYIIFKDGLHIKPSLQNILLHE